MTSLLAVLATHDYAVASILKCLLIWAVIGFLVGLVVHGITGGFKPGADPERPHRYAVIAFLLVFAVGSLFCILP